MRQEIFKRMLLCGIVVSVFSTTSKLNAEGIATSNVSAVGVKEYFHRITPTSRSGSEYYRKGDYKKAFKKLSYRAERGFKQAQYLIAVMYLKGQYVEQSLLKGMSWLGVANEIELSKEWHQLYQQIFLKLTTEQRIIIDANVAIYIKRYGASANGVSCDKRLTGISRKLVVQCTKEEGFYTVFPIINALHADE